MAFETHKLKYCLFNFVKIIRAVNTLLSRFGEGSKTVTFYLNSQNFVYHKDVHIIRLLEVRPLRISQTNRMRETHPTRIHV